jgi:serine/threonine-protein kinase
MRLVRGQTLGEAIAAYLAREKEGKTEPLELRRLLGAFVNVCQAVGYAHSRGVVHRDLKPDNVVLGAFGEVVLLDWGLARLVDDATTREDEIVPVQVDSQAPAEATQAGQQLGTPAYMAPEQAEGRLELIDGRTDVYGLGAILFEILSGRPPHQGSSTAEVLRGIVHGGSPQVRAVNPRVPAALEAICAKAMAKSPSGRYVKATQLADDVQRWLADEPVSAHAEPWSLRAGRWMRKHRTLVASTVAAMTLALVFLATLAILVERQKGELAQQNVALAQAADAEREAKEQANRNFQLAQESVDRNFTEVSEDVLLNEPGFQPLRKQLLQGSREFYQRFIDQRRGDPALRAGLARAYQRLAVITDAIDAKEEAISHQREAVRLYEALQREDHDSESLQQDLALAYSNLGDFYLELDQVSPAERACRSSLELSERLVAAHPSSPTHLAQLVRALHGFALLHLKTGNTFEAENSSPRPGKSSPRFSPKILEALAASSRHEFCEPSAPSMWERSGRKRRSPCCSRRATCSSIQQNEAPRSWSTLPPWRCALEALGPLSATLGWRVTRRRRTRGRKICGKS